MTWKEFYPRPFAKIMRGLRQVVEYERMSSGSNRATEYKVSTHKGRTVIKNKTTGSVRIAGHQPRPTTALETLEMIMSWQKIWMKHPNNAANEIIQVLGNYGYEIVRKTTK